MQNLKDAFNKSGLETLAQINKATEVALQSTEQLVKLNMEFAKTWAQHSNECASNWLSDINNPQDATKKATDLINRSNEHVRAHLQSLCDWAESCQQNTQVIAESQLSHAQDNIKEQLETLRASAPAQLHGLFDQVKNSFETAQSTVSSLQKTAKEVQRNVAQTVKKTAEAANAVATPAAAAAKK